jgi:tetratricopeptide (TPR) repeat protein
MASRVDPRSAVKWLERLESKAHGPHAAELAVRRAGVLLYELNEIDPARETLRPLAERTDAVGDLATIRLGDAAFAAGEMNEAVTLYAKAQKVSTKAESWRADAVLDAAVSETVKSLIRQEFHEEALKELDTWERRFPLSKISGDYMVQEARLYVALRNYQRARRLLEIYVENTDASSFLPEAMKLLLTCMIEMKASDDEIRAWAEKMKQRLKFHPDAGDIDDILGTLWKE